MVLADRDGRILGCHATGRPKDSGYDFPKGMVDASDSSDFAAACRELSEETGLTLDFLEESGVLVTEYVIDCGVFPHNKEKDIHIFVCPVKEFPTEHLECRSFFELPNGRTVAEVDGYAVIGKDDRIMFNKVLQNKFPIIDEALQKIEWR